VKHRGEDPSFWPQISSLSKSSAVPDGRYGHAETPWIWLARLKSFLQISRQSSAADAETVRIANTWATRKGMVKKCTGQVGSTGSESRYGQTRFRSPENLASDTVFQRVPRSQAFQSSQRDQKIRQRTEENPMSKENHHVGARPKLT